MCPGVNGKPAHLADAQSKNGPPELDHTIEVAQHFKDDGHDQTMAERAVWYQNSGNLETICKSCNSGKSGPPYTFEVGPKFRGPRDPP